MSLHLVTQFIRDNLACSGVHNFSLGSIHTYFRLGEMIKKQKVIVNEAGIISILGQVKKHFVLKPIDVKLATSLQKTASIYSAVKLELSKESKFNETAYTLA